MADQRSRRFLLATAAFALLLFAGTSLGQGITVDMTPAWQQVESGSQFDLDLTIPQAGAQFNAFSAIIDYDPSALTLLPADPLSFQEGTLMLEACGNTFHRFHQGADRDTIVDALLCEGIAVTGPGQIYHLRFQASGPAQETQVQFLLPPKFSVAGIYVTPVQSGDAVIDILPPTSGVGRGIGPTHLQVRVSPNPGRGRMVFSMSSDRPGPLRLDLLDLQGRQVRRFEVGAGSIGTMTVIWDGRTGAGDVLPSGVYLVRLVGAGCAVSSRVLLVR